MYAKRTACILSAGIMLAAAIPALAHPSDRGGRRAVFDRHPQRVVVQPRHHRPAVRDVVVRRPVFVERRAFVGRPVVRHVLVPRPVYLHPPFAYYERPVYYERPLYYSEPAYYADAAPARAASAPPPPPPPRTMTPAPAPKRFTFSADALFDFDQAIVKPEGRRQLEKLAADLKGAQFDVITVTMVTVTGHTDRIGSAEYNMRLSTRRAVAVKAHLVELGIPAAKIAATGQGETNPVTKPGECKGDKATRDLIACLQPDRRVEVEVSVAK